jgi:hypothetical protein
VFVDTVAPHVSVQVTGTRIVNAAERVRVTYSDPPPAGQPRSAASGVARVLVTWGDGSQTQIRRNTATHVYLRRRTYTMAVTATDRAGNETVVRRKLQIQTKGAKRTKGKSRHRGRRR